MPDTEINDPWHRRPLANSAVRACGLLALFTAWQAGKALVLRGGAAHADFLDNALGLIAFLGASAGAAATLLGAHLFDQVPIASRWGQAPTLDGRKATIPSAPRSTDSRSPDRSRSATA